MVRLLFSDLDAPIWAQQRQAAVHQVPGREAGEFLASHDIKFLGRYKICLQEAGSLRKLLTMLAT